MEDVGEYLGLPEDPELAFVEYVRRRHSEMNDGLQSAGFGEEGWSYTRDCKMTFLNKVMAFHDAHDFSFLEGWDVDRYDEQFANEFDKFLDRVQRVSTEITVRHARRLKPISTIITLPDEIRKHIHAHIEKIRISIVPLNLKPEKKETLFAKLNALSDEVDRDRTKTEALTAFVLELASAGSQAAKELAPIRELTESITNLIAKAKELAERLGLPKPGPQKRIEGPKKQLPKPRDRSFDRKIDDEIPF